MTRRTDRRRVFAKRFRTSMCKEFVETGACKYGFDCLYAHTADQLRTEDMNRDVTSEMVVQWAEEQRQSLSAVVLPTPSNTIAGTPEWSLSMASLPSAVDQWMCGAQRHGEEDHAPQFKSPATRAHPAYFQRVTDVHCLPLRRLLLVKGRSSFVDETVGTIASNTNATERWVSPRWTPYDVR